MRWVGLLLAVEVAVFVVSTVPGVRSEAGFDPLLDGWLQGTAYVTAAVLCSLRPLTVRPGRRLWTFVAAALWLRALAFVVYLTVIREMDPIPYPSLADVGWIGMCVVLLAGLIDHARRNYTRTSTALLLDGIVGALAMTALALALLWETLVKLTADGLPGDAVVTNLTYPIADVLLLVVLLGVLIASAWRAPPAIWALAGGVGAFAVVDSVFLYQTTAGTYRPGTAIAALSLVATSLIASAAWVGSRREARPRLEALPGVALPAVFALICVGLLVVATGREIPATAIALATLGLIGAIIRTGLAFRTVRAVADARPVSRVDDLTGTSDRQGFNEHLETELRLRPHGRLALLVCDVDDFRDVNESLGHHRGDELLRLMAARLQSVLRDDDLLARIGGDQFAIVLEDADGALAGRLAERLQRELRSPFGIAGVEVHATASLGIAVYPDDGLQAAELLRRAELAMADAKASRVGYRFFRAEQHRSTRERVEAVDRLRQAIDGGEMVLHFQPQVSLDSGAVVGAEALVRWQHPSEGLLAPGHFLPQVESGGLMRRLSHEVLRQAVCACAAWRAEGHDPRIAVNLSVTDLLDAELPSQVTALLDEMRVPGDRLELELTEDLFMADPGRADKVIRVLLDAGVSIVVDDYGTGFSSLGYLRDLRDIAGLKLDRSFVAGLDADRRAQAIVGSTVALADSLGLQLVAEGVETRAERDCLVDLGCELAQGFLFGRPVPPDQLDFGVVATARRGQI